MGFYFSVNGVLMFAVADGSNVMLLLIDPKNKTKVIKRYLCQTEETYNGVVELWSNGQFDIGYTPKF